MNAPDLPKPIRELSVDRLHAAIYPDRQAMGMAAARHVGSILSRRLREVAVVRMVVGSAPSQDEFFQFLTSAPVVEMVDWSRVEVFHMDEYVGLPASHPQSFRHYQHRHFVSRVRLAAFHEIRGEAGDPAAECDRLASLLAERPVDLVCLGIGENGHLAFNDPGVADFHDPELVKVVNMDDVCRQQQVNDGCFPSLSEVPTRAITLTLKVFAEASFLSGVVPARTKANAVAATLTGPVSTDCPATLMRVHPSARLFLDPQAASLI